MINEYRRQYDLPPIQLSRSLCYVANTHAKDLFFHHPDQEPCNFHSWSDKGPWKPFCYPRDEDKKNSVWDKPKELTGYPEKGFEIVYWENNAVVIDSVIAFWKSFDYFNSFLTNTGRWEGYTWNAIGIGICQNYAAAWFGKVVDPLGTPFVCGQKPPESKPDTVKHAPNHAVKQTTIQNDERSPVSAVPPKTTISPPGTTPIKGHYCIIIKSQLPLKEATKLVQQLTVKGYSQARVLQSEEKIRISLYDTADRDEALRLLKEAKKLYPDAWLFKQ